jgi:hypothetical protein
MRAIVIEKFGGPEGLGIHEVPTPKPRSGEVVIRVKAFRVNHAERTGNSWSSDGRRDRTASGRSDARAAPAWSSVSCVCAGQHLRPGRMRPGRVIIVGAGIGGMSLAAALQRLDVPVLRRAGTHDRPVRRLRERLCALPPGTCASDRPDHAAVALVGSHGTVEGRPARVAPRPGLSIDTHLVVRVGMRDQYGYDPGELERGVT